MEALTKQENKVAELVARGYSEKEIADHLFVSYKTVHAHTYNIRKKIGAKTAVDITRKFILSLPDPKKFFLSIAFLAIQAHAMFNCPDKDFVRLRVNSRPVSLKTAARKSS